MGDDESQDKIKASDEKGVVNASVESTNLDYNELANTTFVDKLQERIRELEVLVGGKEEALHVALQGLDSAMGVEVEYRAQLEGCRARIGEFQQAVQHRDQLIGQLSASLEHTLRARDELAQDGERLAQEVSLLRSQLQATSELVAQGSSKSQHDFMLLQHKNLAIEDTLKKKDLQIEEMQRQLTEQKGVKKELEVKKEEFARYKTEAATHVQQLMKEVERLHRESANSKSMERQQAQQLLGVQEQHQREMAMLRAELEEQFGEQLMQIQEKHRSQFLEQDLKKQQTSPELTGASSLFSSSSSDNSNTQQQLQELSERATQVASEREDLLSQLALYKEQVQSLSEKLLRTSADDSQQCLLGDLQKENKTLAEQVESLRNKLHALEEEKVQELQMYQEAQVTEVTAWKKRVNSLIMELQKVSEVAESYLQRLEECSKVHEVELMSLRQAHAQELKFLGGQLEGMHQLREQVDQFHNNLQEKTSMEKRLQTELQASIRGEEDLKGRLMEVEEELQVLKGAFKQQKDVLQRQSNDLEKLSTELLEKERSELVLKEELALLKDKIKCAKSPRDDKLYKEQIDKLNGLLQQKTNVEEMLKRQLSEKEKIEQALKKEMEAQSKRYKEQLNALNIQLEDKTKIEEQLRTELKEKVQAGEILQNELKSVKYALDQLKEATGEAEVYKTQVDSLNKQLQEQSQSEHDIICDYETRVKTLTFDLTTIESRLSSEIQDIQARARDELQSKQDTEKRLEGELEAVRSELITLKSSSEVQEYKEQINKLNLLVQEKQKTEATLKAELEAVSVEVAALKENQQHLENLNSNLEERLRTEQRLQEELIAAAKMHKEQVDVLSAKISELTSQQNSLDNEAHSMRQEINAQKSYIHDLELIREQVSQSAKTKEVLINDLSVCVKSLTEDNASYQQKLENLNKRLDDECHRADENMMLREVYEKEISEHKQHIEDLEKKLQEALQAREAHLKEISIHQQELKSYKEQLEILNSTFTKEIAFVQQKCTNPVDENVRGTDALKKELEDTKTELSSCKKHIDNLNHQIMEEKKKTEAEYKTKGEILQKEMENLKNQLLVITETKNKLEEEKKHYSKELEATRLNLASREENWSREIDKFTNTIKNLETDIAAKDKHISKLNMELEEAVCKFDEVNKLLMEAQQRFSQDKEADTKLWTKEESDTKIRDNVSESHSIEIEGNVSGLQVGVQEDTPAQEKSSRNQDSLNFSSISETELLQLENKLQNALSEKNEIEKSFKDHINKLAENHLKEVAVYEEQLQAAHLKLEQLVKIHSNCTVEKNTLRDEMNKLILSYEGKINAYEEKLSIAGDKMKELSEVHEKCHFEKETLENLIIKLEKEQEQKDSANDNMNKLSAQFEKDMLKYVEQLKIANETLDDLSKKYSDTLADNDSLKEKIAELGKVQQEICVYKEEVKKISDKYEDLSSIHAKCITEKECFEKIISEKELTCQERNCAFQKKTEALTVCQKELVQTREYMELLKVNLQDEISKVHVELHNLVNICAPPRNETRNEEVDSKEIHSEEMSFTNGKEDWSPDWSQKEGNGSLEQSFVCAATIHHDVSSLRGHVVRLVSDLHSIRQKSSATEGLLAAKIENEAIFKKHIEQLEEELHKNVEDGKVIKEQLEELTVKFLTAQSLLAGKVEAENSLQREVAEMDVNACNRCKHLEEDISRLNLTLLEVEEKLKNAEREKEKAVNRCKQFEEEREKLFSEKTNLQKLIEDLKKKTENSQLLNNKISRLEEMLKESENAQNSVVLEYSSLKEEHTKLLVEKQRLEEVLEELKAEVVRFHEHQNENFEYVSRSSVEELQRDRSDVEKGTQEQLSCVKEDVVCVRTQVYNTNYSVEGSLDFSDYSAFAAGDEEAMETAPVDSTGDTASLLKPKRSLHSVVLKLIQQCSLLDSAKRTLAAECDTLLRNLEERAAQEMLFNEELAAANSRCAALEQRLQEAHSKASSHEAVLGAKLALECEVQALVGENSALKAEKVSLVQELSALKEEMQSLHTTAEMGSGNTTLDKNSYAEWVAMKEKLSFAERERQMLGIQVDALEKTKKDMLKQFEVVLEEARHLREQLESAWQERAETEEQLGRARCELAIAGLHREKRESRANGINADTTSSPVAHDGPVFHLHQEVHTLVEEMAQELVGLREALHLERSRHKQRAGEERSSPSSIPSSTTLPQEGEQLAEAKEDTQQIAAGQEATSAEGDLLTQLSVYREQHEGLAEVIGSAGPLQESLRQQKEELLALLQAKSAVEEQLASEKAEAMGCRVKLQLLEQQLHEKDLLYQELFQQKSNLQADLQQLEEKLREREQLLQMQRAQLQGELRAQQLRLRRWQLQQRASEMERKLDESLRASPSERNSQPETSDLAFQSHLQTLRQEMQQAHSDAVSRLKQHLETEFSVREQALKAGFSAELARTEVVHAEELARMQHALQEAEKEVDRLRNAELARCLGIGSCSSQELAATKERYEKELETICSGLDESQAHLFAVLKHLFEEFARQLMAGTTTLVQSQNEKVVEREKEKLNSICKQQLEQLRAKLEGDHVKDLQALQEKQKVSQEAMNSMVAVPESTCSVMAQLHSADSSQVAIVQLKHLLYSEFTHTLREATKDWTTEWKMEVSSQLQALERALDEEAATLQRLRNSPETQQINAGPASCARPLEKLLDEAEGLMTRAEAVLERKLKVAEQALRVVGERLDAAFSPVAERAKLMAAAHQDSKENIFPDGDATRDQYRQLVQQLSVEHAAEVGRLRELLAQLEARRAREMEELRQYFEQKVQELEKHYSEEITSQHSRRHSSSSCDSDSEFATDALLGSGDHALSRIPPLTHICDTCAADPGYKELEERWKGEVAKRVEEGRAHLAAAKKELEAHYEGELSLLRNNYEEKLSRLAQELTSDQQAAVRAARASAGKSLQALWRREIQNARTRLLKTASRAASNIPEHDDEATLNERTDVNDSRMPEVRIESHEQETLEDLCIELSSQLRLLEATCKQYLKMQLEKLQKEKELQTERAVEDVSTQSVEQVLTKMQLEEKVRAEVRAELEQELEQQVEKVAAMMKANAEQEQMMFIENQKQMMKEFLEQHRHDLEILKKQHQTELSKAKTVVKSNDAIPFTEATQLKIHPVSRCDETSQTEQEPLPKKLDAAVSPSHCMRLNKEVQTEEPDVQNVSMYSQEMQTSLSRVSPVLVDSIPDCLRAQPFVETNLVSMLSELSSIEPVELVESESEDVRVVLIGVQTECAKFLEAMLQEWMELQHRINAGLVVGGSEVKFLTKEYVTECCSRLKVILSTIEAKMSELQEASNNQLASSKSSREKVCEGDCTSSLKFAEIVQERDRWRQVGLVLKKLVEELLSYLSECEDEVNHTLLSEQVGVEDESSVREASVVTEEVSKAEDSPAATPHRTPKFRGIKRVHFAPTSFDLKNINEQMLLEFIQEDQDLTAKLRAELDVCLEQLRTEATTLMESPLMVFPSTPHRGVSVEGEQLEVLTQALTAARQRIVDLETERRMGVRAEEVAEGFGEQLSSTHQGAALGLRLHSLSQLQDKARSILANGRPSSPQEAQQLQLLDEICREGDRLAEEARREREDLRQQVPPHPTSPALPPEHSVCCGCCHKVESADKRLRDTRRFLEEQAAEREQERDEFHQELSRLQEQLRAREKDLADQQRLSREVEALEQQSKEALTRHQQLEAHRESLQSELKAAVDKVWLLRDVVAELELQAEAKDARAAHLEARLQEVQQALHEQEASRQQLSEELESLRAEGGHELSRQVAALQEQLHAHRLQAEQCRPSALKQMKSQIRELEAHVERRTQQLEALHTLSSNQSSPSEDVSVREMFQCDSPDEMRATVASPSLAGSVGSSPRSPPLPPTPLPLRELARLQERLQRHARAEEAALKKTRDLEMQLKAARRAEEEASAERDILQERVSEQLLRIASLEALVDAGRWKGSCGGQEEEDEEEQEQEQEQEQEHLREQQLLLQRAQDAEEEAARMVGDLERARHELHQLKEVIAQAEAESARREEAFVTQLQNAQQAEALLRQHCQALESQVQKLSAEGEMGAPGGDSAPASLKVGNEECNVCKCGKLSGAGEDVDTLQQIVELQAAQQRAQSAEEQLCVLSAQAQNQMQEMQRLRTQLEEMQRALDDAQRERDAAQGLEELAGQVVKELEASAQLDSSLRDHIGSVSLYAASEVPNTNLSETSSRVDGELPSSRHSVQLVQSTPPPTNEESLQLQIQELHLQLHQQLQQMKIAAQTHAQKENELEKLIVTEKDHVCEVQRALRREQRRVLDLQSQLASQAVRAGLAVDETRLQQASQEAEQEKSRVHALELQLQQEHSVVRQLKTALLKERQRFQEAQRRDAQLLHTMRLRLVEVTTANEKKHQQEHQVIPKAEEPQPVSTSKSSEHAVIALSSPPPVQVDEAPVAARGSTVPQFPPEIVSELQRRLSGAQSEIRTLRRRLNREQEVAQQLRAELNLLRSHNDGLDGQLSEVRAALSAQQAENDQLARQLRSLEEAELRQKSRASTERSIAQERTRQLETNVAQLEAEVAAERAVREDAVVEANRLREEAEALRQEMNSATVTRVRNQTASPTTETITQHQKDVTASPDQQVKEHSEVALTLARLLEERRELQLEVNTRSEQLLHLQTSEAKAQASISRLTAEKASVTEECIALRLELARVKDQLCLKRSETADTQELENRVNHLFGRYLRAESYRKALAWQKKYLLVALGGYQQTEAYTLSQLAQLASASQGSSALKSSSSTRARTRFRSAALVIVVIHRMKFLVRRWYYGRQIGGSTVLNKSYSESLFSGLSAHGLRSGRGNSAMSMSSWSGPASASAFTSLGAAPHSPPSHDRSSMGMMPESHYFPSWRSTEGLADGLTGNLAPSRFTQFVERYDTLQHRLGLSAVPTLKLTSPSSSHRAMD